MKKLGLIALAVVMALGMLGVGYAWWTDTLTINGTVTTGKLDVRIVDVTSDDPQGHQEIPPYDAAETLVVKGGDQKSASITINNAYPGYASGASIKVTNMGTVPVKVKSIVVAQTAGNQPDLLRYMTLEGWTFIDDNGPIVPADINYVLAAGGSAQFDANFSFDTDLPYQQANLSLTATIVFNQFNNPDAPVVTVP